MSTKRQWRRRTTIGVGVSVGATLGIAPAAQALEYEVDNLGDSNAFTTCDAGTDNDCSLRQAVNVANDSSPVSDVIVFESGLSGSIVIGSQLLVQDPLQINGPGASQLTIDANEGSGIFYAGSGADPLGVSGLTLTDGKRVGGGNGGGAIRNPSSANAISVTDSVLSSNEAASGGAVYSYGPVTIDGSTVSGNAAPAGGGGGVFLLNGGASLMVTDSTLSANHAPGSIGGAINSNNGDQVTIDGSTISGNDANAAGAIEVYNGDLAINGSTVSGNTATSFDGGGIRVRESEDTSIERSTISGNSARRGGGFASDRSTVAIEGSTISGNHVPPGGTDGGGIHITSDAPAQTVTVSNSTIAGNDAFIAGGGASFDDLGGGAPDPVLSNTIVADNTAPAGRDLDGNFGASFSLIESAAGAAITATVPGSNLAGQDPKLGPLADNGGPTATRKPLAGSPVIDRGSTAASADQRGRARPVNIPGIASSPASGADGADIGAVELARNEIPACGGRPATIAATGRRVTGTVGPDVIVGTPKANVIRGRGGKDVICGLAGSDRLVGGAGGDTLIGGKGRDTLRGGPGRDKLKGGPGQDILRP